MFETFYNGWTKLSIKLTIQFAIRLMNQQNVKTAFLKASRVKFFAAKIFNPTTGRRATFIFCSIPIMARPLRYVNIFLRAVVKELIEDLVMDVMCASAW